MHHGLPRIPCQHFMMHMCIYELESVLQMTVIVIYCLVPSLLIQSKLPLKLLKLGTMWQQVTVRCLITKKVQSLLGARRRLCLGYTKLVLTGPSLLPTQAAQSPDFQQKPRCYWDDRFGFAKSGFRFISLSMRSANALLYKWKRLLHDTSYSRYAKGNCLSHWTNKCNTCWRLV